MSELDDALKKLAQRGTPRGFEHVLAGAAAESAERAVRDDGDLDPIPFVTAEPVVRRRRPLGSMIAAAGVAALLLVGAFAVSAVVGDGGSSSAEGAVRRLADAISHEDPLAAADILAPDEVRSLPDTVSEIEKKAKEMELVQTAGAPLAGVDLNVDDLKLSTQSLGDGYAKVTVDSGSFTASTHKAQFSPLMQKVLHGSKDNSLQRNLATLAASKQLPTFVVAVRRGGHWYVSASYTVLEYVREWNQLPAADFGSGDRAVSTLGADSPDAAVQDSMRALERRDWGKLLTMVRPDEIPFYDYRAAFTELARRSDTGNSSSWFTIDAMTTSAQTDGDTSKVTLHASGKTSSGTWTVDGGCLAPIGGSESSSTSDSSGAGSSPSVGSGATSGTLSTSSASARSTCDLGTPYLYLSPLALPYEGLGSGSQFTVVKQGGRWFVSPVGTVLDLLDNAITKLDRRSVYQALGIPEQLPPDGPLTLGQPVVLTKADHGPRVLTLAGKQGEQLLGLATTTPGTPEFQTAALVKVYGPDGAELDGDGGVLFAQPLTLPADGTYKIVVLGEYYASNADVSVTLWNAADAPAAAKKNRSFNSGNGTCTYTAGGESCTSSSGTVPVAVAPGVTVKGSGQNGGGSYLGGGQSTGTTATTPTTSTLFPPATATPAPTMSVGTGISSSATSTPPGG